MVSLSFAQITAAQIEDQVKHYNQNRGHVIIVVTTIFYFLAVLLVLLRFATRRWKHIKYRIEDYLIVLALILASGLYTETILAVRYGAGKHSIRVFREHGVENISKSLQVLFALELTYNLTHLTIKASILFLYRSMFTFVVVPFQRAWYFVFGYITLNFVIAFVIVFTQCRPLHYTWDEPKGAKGKCVNLNADELSTGLLIALADLMLLVLPIPILWRLKIPRKDKLLLCGLFGLGSLALVASIARVSTLGAVTSSVDFTFVEVGPLIWTIIEVDLGIICACIPTVRPLFARRQRNSSSAATPPYTQGTGPSGFRRTENSSFKTKPTSSIDEYPLAEGQALPGMHRQMSESGKLSSDEHAELRFLTTSNV